MGVSQATGYRYLHEGIDVPAEWAPDLVEVLDRCRRQGLSHVIFDSTLIADAIKLVRDSSSDVDDERTAFTYAYGPIRNVLTGRMMTRS